MIFRWNCPHTGKVLPTLLRKHQKRLYFVDVQASPSGTTNKFTKNKSFIKNKSIIRNIPNKCLRFRRSEFQRKIPSLEGYDFDFFLV